MKRGTPRHRKMRELARLLDIPLAHAVGIMEMLWHYTGQETPEGDIGTATDQEIAAAVTWSKKPSQLVDALVSANWLDRDERYRLVIHDWPDHAEQAVIKMLARSKRDFLPTYGRSLYDKTSRRSSGRVSGHVSGQNTDESPLSRGAWLGLASVSENSTETSNNGNPPRCRCDPEFLKFRSAVEQTGGKWSQPDWDEAFAICWKTLDFEQKLAATKGIRDRVGTDDFVLRATPLRYLEKRMWERGVRTKDRLAGLTPTERAYYKKHPEALKELDVQP